MDKNEGQRMTKEEVEARINNLFPGIDIFRINGKDKKGHKMIMEEIENKIKQAFPGAEIISKDLSFESDDNEHETEKQCNDPEWFTCKVNKLFVETVEKSIELKDNRYQIINQSIKEIIDEQGITAAFKRFQMLEKDIHEIRNNVSKLCEEALMNSISRAVILKIIKEKEKGEKI